jgi:hypothetical protein
MAALVQLGEGACLAVAATFEQYLAAELSAVSAAYAAVDIAEFGAALPLLPPRRVYPRNQSVIAETPAVVVSWLGLDESANGAPTFGEMTHRLDAAALCVSDRLDVAEAQALRYLQAMWTVIKLHQGLDGNLSGLSGIDTPHAGKSAAYSADGQTIIGAWAGLELRVRVTESVSA